MAKENIYLADLLNALKSDASIPAAIKERYPDLSVRNYRAGLHVIWLLLTQLYYQDSLTEVENSGVIDKGAAEELITNYIEKLKCYREDPEDYIGRSVESAESEI
jgi:hypothetical protein